MLFIIYFDDIVQNYENKLQKQISDKRPEIIVRNKQSERKWARAQELRRFRQKGEKRHKPSHLKENWTQAIKCDTLTYDDDLINKVPGRVKYTPQSLHLKMRKHLLYQHKRGLNKNYL